MDNTRSPGLNDNTLFGRIVRWGSLFVAILAALWLTTQSTAAPQLILLVLVYVIVINFSIPLSVGYMGLAPLVAIGAFWTLDFESALFTALIGLTLAELISPVWEPLWRATASQQGERRQRLLQGVALLITIAATGWIFRKQVGQPSLAANWLGELAESDFQFYAPLLYAALFLLSYNVLVALIWLVYRRSLLDFINESGLTTLALLLVSLPLSLIVATSAVTLPVFVMLCVGMGGAAIISWAAWRQRFLMARRLQEFADLNRIGATLRETLDYGLVLRQTYDMVQALIPSAESISIVLHNADGQWEQALPNATGSAELIKPYTPDDFTLHVVNRNKLLDLDPDNMHFAARHNLIPPSPQPRVWLGAPLTSAEQVTGAIVVQKIHNDEPFTRWNREVLVAIAGQVSAAIQNARLYGETVRLYNLTDEALAQRLEQLQALLNATTDGVLMVDRNGQIVLVNPTAAQFMGQPLAALHNSQLEPETAATVLGYDRDQLKTALAQLETGHDPDTTRVIFELNGQGERRFIEREELPVSAENQQLMGWLIILRDVTEDRERAEWRADLTRMIVHDLRNPVTTLSSTVTQIEKRLPDPERADISHLLFTARRGCDNMLEMVDAMMDINRAEAGKLIADPDAIRLTNLTEHVFDYIRPLAERRNIELNYTIDHEAPPAWADMELTRRILTNLLDNALKFTPSGGHVTGLVQTEPALPGHEPGNRVTILDTGPGIPESLRARIFERFVTFNRGGGQIRGTGLGLTFCKMAVEAQGGAIWVEEGPDGGSAFVFTLPGIPEF